MNTARTLAPLSLCAAALLGLAAFSAPARADDAAPRSVLPRVVVEGRVPLQASCPDAEEKIQEALALVVARKRDSATLRVRFALDGDRISELQISHGPSAYTVPLQHVLSQLRCQGSTQYTQVHQFVVALSLG